uniref:Uncharacterized protein n=1 Tax=Caenorhabditis japonica TaxID=281687 RepID=A0A8R1EP79_CAEJA
EMNEDEESENQKDKKNSDAIVADLLNDLKSSEKPFTVDKLAGCDETDVVEKKRKKHHKHKSHHKSSKKRKKDRKRSRSRSRARGAEVGSRSRSR